MILIAVLSFCLTSHLCGLSVAEANSVKALKGAQGRFELESCMGWEQR